MKIFRKLKRSKQDCLTIISTVFAALSLIGVDFKTIDLWRKIAIFIAVGLAVIIVVYSLVHIFKRKLIYRLKYEADKITYYMADLYKRSGSILICTTGRLKWLNTEIKNELGSKAVNRNLIIFCATRSSDINELERKGATVFDTHDLGIKPKSNSSIMNANANDMLVAVGYSEGNYHIIDEYDAKSSITNTINDLEQIVQCLIKQNQQLKKTIVNIKATGKKNNG